LEEGAAVELTGNVWKAIEVDQVLTEDTVLRFDLAAEDLGEILAVGFDNTRALSGLDEFANFFQLGGSQVFEQMARQIAYTQDGDTQRFEIAVGADLTGAFRNLVLVGDDDADASTSAIFSNIAFFERPALQVDGAPRRVESYAPGQDEGEAQVSPTGRDITLSGNAWKAVGLETTITEDTWLSFELEAEDMGEITGIGLDNNDALSLGRVFNLGGAQDLGILDFASYELGDGRVHFDIPVGQFYTGAASRLFFVADDDADSSADVTFSNVVLTEGRPVFVGEALVAPQGNYGNQGAGTVEITNEARDIRIADNGWQSLEVDVEVRPDTVIAFEIRGTDPGEAVLVGVDKNESLSLSQLVQLAGSQDLPTGGKLDVPFDGAFHRVEVEIGKLVAPGTYKNLVLAVDDDDDSSGAAEFRNIEILQAPTSFEVSPHGGDQDQGRALELGDSGTLKLVENAWKELLTGELEIDENTVLHFEFRSDVEGEIHGIGFDNNSALSPSTLYQLSGTQEFGRQDVAGAYRHGEGFEAYEIAVGEHFAGRSFDRLVFAMDEDTPDPIADGSFRDVYITGLGQEDTTLQIL
jgi:hypothetical protein